MTTIRGGGTSADLVGAWQSTYHYEKGTDYVDEDQNYGDLYIAFFNDGTWIASEDEMNNGNFYFYAYDYGTWTVKNGEITMVSSDPGGDHGETFTVKLNGSELTIEENGYVREESSSYSYIDYDNPYYEKIIYTKLSSNPDSFEYYYD